MTTGMRECINREEVCNSWNDTFPELNMCVSDLNSPTEPFLTRIFLHYLRAFGFIVEPPFSLKGDFDNDSSREKRFFLIKITRHIENILQISVKTRTFSYYDLIKPTPKKTIIVLDILYNYLCFFNMYKEEVYKSGHDHVKNHEELLVQIAEVKQETEQRKKRTFKVFNDIEMLTTKKRNTASQLETLHRQRKVEQQIVQNLKDDVEELEKSVSNDKIQKQHWKKLVVRENEMDALMEKNRKLRDDIKICKDETNGHEETLRERKDDIESLTELCSLVAEAHTILPDKMSTVFKETKKQLEKKTKLHKAQELDIIEASANIEKLMQKLQTATENLKLRTKQHELEKTLLKESVEQKKCTTIKTNKKHEELEKVVHDLELEIAEEHNIQQNLLCGLAELFMVESYIAE